LLVFSAENPAGAGVAGSVPVAVLDTSVLYGDSSRRELVAAIREGRFDGIWSPHVVAELNRALTVRWVQQNGFGNASLRRLSRAAKDMMDVLLSTLQLVDSNPVDGEEPILFDDVDDYHLIRAARLARATFVVSANTRDFPKRGRDGRRVLDGVEFIERAPFLSRIAR